MAQIVSARMCVVSWIQLLPAQGGTMTGGPEEPKLIRVVGAAIVKDGKVLCAQRGSGKTLSGYWEFPGGKIEEGETPQQALRREIGEELLCEINVDKEVCTSDYLYDFGYVELTTFLCHLIEGSPKLTEHTRMVLSLIHI